VVASKGARRKEAMERMTTNVWETAKKGGRTAAPTSPAGRQPTQQPQERTTGLSKPSSGATAMKTGPTPASRMVTLPRRQRTSAVTLTLSEGAKTTYAEVIATARRSIPLTEIGVKSVGMRKAVTSAIIIQVPDDKGREKALQLVTHLSKVLDPTAVKVAAATRTAELKVIGIDISIEKKELRQALALGTECGVAEIQVGSLQKRPRGRACKVPGGRSPQIGQGRESSLGMVHREGYRDPKEAAPMLQMPRARTRTSHMRVHCGTREPVL
jgi:hypothetical protein